MQDRKHRTDQRIDETAGAAGLRASVFGMRWSHVAAQGRCQRCRRPVRPGEAILVLDDGEQYCVLCGRRHWSRSVEAGG
jgi:hypothetical protein